MQKISLPRISERIRAFTLPEEGAFCVSDYDEVYRISLTGELSIEVLDDDPYEFAARPECFGVSLHAPILEVGASRISYVFEPSQSQQNVSIVTSKGLENLSFRTFSGDWFVATLSRDGRFLIIAEPYLIEVYALP